MGEISNVQNDDLVVVYINKSRIFLCVKTAWSHPIVCQMSWITFTSLSIGIVFEQLLGSSKYPLYLTIVILNRSNSGVFILYQNIVVFLAKCCIADVGSLQEFRIPKYSIGAKGSIFNLFQDLRSYLRGCVSVCEYGDRIRIHLNEVTSFTTLGPSLHHKRICHKKEKKKRGLFEC